MSIIQWDTFQHLFESPRTPSFEGRFTRGLDLAVLLRLAHHIGCRRILELYTALGDTARALAFTCPDATIVTVDITSEMELPVSRFNSAGEVLPRETVGQAYHGTPEARRIQQVLCDPRAYDFSSLGTFDLVFIDGNHDYEHVKFDTALALGMLAPRGALVWDDYWAPCPEIIRFIDGLNRLSGNIIFNVDRTRVCFVLLTPKRLALLREIVATST
jgi:predicted O-methyltransferase YrrM